MTDVSFEFGNYAGEPEAAPPLSNSARSDEPGLAPVLNGRQRSEFLAQ
jgi:hypothetical protein